MEPHVYVVSAGFEHQRFTNLFPSWESDKKATEANRPFVIIKSPHRSDASEELKKLSRDRYSLAELKRNILLTLQRRLSLNFSNFHSLS